MRTLLLTLTIVLGFVGQTQAYESRGISGFEHLYALNSSGLCAITIDGLKCWSEENYTGSNPLAEATPRLDVEQLSAGQNHFCALTKDQVFCWGSNTFGQLDVPVLQQPVKILSGPFQTCAQEKSGNIKCWGLVSHSAELSCSYPTSEKGLLADLGAMCSVLSVTPRNPSLNAAISKQLPVYPILNHGSCSWIPKVHLLAGFSTRQCTWDSELSQPPGVAIDLHKSVIHTGTFCTWDDQGFVCNGPLKGRVTKKEVKGIERMFINRRTEGFSEICYQTKNKISCAADGVEFHDVVNTKSPIRFMVPLFQLFSDGCVITSDPSEKRCRDGHGESFEALTTSPNVTFAVPSKYSSLEGYCWIEKTNLLKCENTPLDKQNMAFFIPGYTFPEVILDTAKAIKTADYFSQLDLKQLVSPRLYKLDRAFLEGVQKLFADNNLAGVDIFLLDRWYQNLDYAIDSNELVAAIANQKNKHQTMFGKYRDLKRSAQWPQISLSIIELSASTSATNLSQPLSKEHLRILLDKNLQHPDYIEALREYLAAVKATPRLSNRYQILLEIGADLL